MSTLMENKIAVPSAWPSGPLPSLGPELCTARIACQCVSSPQSRCLSLACFQLSCPRQHRWHLLQEAFPAHLVWFGPLTWACMPPWRALPLQPLQCSVCLSDPLSSWGHQLLLITVPPKALHRLGRVGVFREWGGAESDLGPWGSEGGQAVTMDGV